MVVIKTFHEAGYNILKPFNLVVQDTAYFPCDMSVKSDFTFDFIFLIHEDSEKKMVSIFFFVESLKWQPNENDR